MPPQDDKNQYVIEVVETNKHVYMFYQVPYQSKSDYLESFNKQLKVSKVHNGSTIYNPCLSSSVLLEKCTITIETIRK